jgi:hypothetical protein
MGGNETIFITNPNPTTMTPDQQRTAIAKACGWTEIDQCTCWHGVSRGYEPTVGAHKKHLPDYLADLNAMHEAEKVLTEKGVNAWWAYVANINRNNPRPLGSESAVHATATKKSKAFLQTLGLWTTTPTQPQ